MLRRILGVAFVVAVAVALPVQANAKDYTVKSPDGKVTLNVSADAKLTWQVSLGDKVIINPSDISLTLYDGTVWGTNVKSAKGKVTSVDTSFKTPFYRRAEVKDKYTQLTLACKGYSVEFRVYDDAAAYRFVGNEKGTVKVKNEYAEYNFAGDHKAFVPYVHNLQGGHRHSYSYESFYDEHNISQMFADSLSATPLIVDMGNGVKATVLDAGCEDYPGMFVKKNPAKANSLCSDFAGVPVDVNFMPGKETTLKTKPYKRSDYIAETSGTRTLPWRVLVVTSNDADLANCDIAQKLAAPCRIDDVSWIKPGRVAWDWLNAINIKGVDFKSGMNTASYKYYIDFASKYGLEYIIIDEGWCKSNLFEINPDIDLDGLIAYGRDKKVGIILWARWEYLLPKTEEVFELYSKKGIKGFKIDFMDDDDQLMMSSLREIANMAAKHKLLVDYHGMKAMSLHRPYPNIVNFEGVMGLENCKWLPNINQNRKNDFPRYDVIIPFGRMLVGPMDYTPGLMRNATRGDYRPVYDAPMSQGTRAHQLAIYAIYDAPLQMFGDTPSNYYGEPECTDFMAAIPSVFDESVVPSAEVGEYIVSAKRKGNTWYAGALTNWTPCTVDVPLSFLGDGTYTAIIFSDGVNADRNAEDYKVTKQTVTKNDVLKAVMQPGGGWAARFEKK